MNLQRIAEDLEREEGFVPHAYQDSEGWWTIGIGTLIDERRGGGISKAEARYLLMNRIGTAEAGLDRNIPWWLSLSEPRQHALLQMAFQMGVAKLMGFRKMLKALHDADYATAADEMLRSRWAEQTPERAKRLARIMRTGT